MTAASRAKTRRSCVANACVLTPHPTTPQSSTGSPGEPLAVSEEDGGNSHDDGPQESSVQAAPAAGVECVWAALFDSTGVYAGHCAAEALRSSVLKHIDTCEGDLHRCACPLCDIRMAYSLATCGTDESGTSACEGSSKVLVRRLKHGKKNAMCEFSGLKPNRCIASAPPQKLRLRRPVKHTILRAQVPNFVLTVTCHGLGTGPWGLRLWRRTSW